MRQSTIDQTICVTGWTSSVRPPESVTEPEKRASLAAYGDTGPLSDYEYDHFVPLELGGATNDPRNLWPEPGASPNPKDAVELSLRDRVCSRELSLLAAQREIVANWVRLAHADVSDSGPRSSAAGCTARAAYDPSYGDYDVYVNSSRPDETVTVTGNGHVRSWHTDSRGGADVYFPGGSGSRGRRVVVTVGGARCTTVL